jgi:hypothetical protein
MTFHPSDASRARTRASRRLGPFALLVAGLLADAGCGDRSHLTTSHGRAVRQALAAQTANPEAGRQPHTLPGLDAQEASSVVKSYRRALMGKSDRSEDPGMLILAPSQTPERPYLPPPSVPPASR